MKWSGDVRAEAGLANFLQQITKQNDPPHMCALCPLRLFQTWTLNVLMMFTSTFSSWFGKLTSWKTAVKSNAKARFWVRLVLGWFCNIIAIGTVNNTSFLRTAKDLCIYFCISIDRWPQWSQWSYKVKYSTFLALKLGKNASFWQAVA